MGRTGKRIVLILMVGLFFFFSYLVYCIQHELDGKIKPEERIEDLKYLPSGKFLRGAALGYDELLSDILWIKAISYFGGHIMTDRRYDWLYHIIDIVTTLDAPFEYPYEFGGVVLAAEVSDVDASIKILKKGMKNVSRTHWRYWYLPFYLGYDYWYYKGDFAAGARYLEVAAKLPGRPPYLPMLVARMHADSGNPEIGIIFLEEMYHSVSNERMKRKIAERIKETMVERDLQMLEKARDAFKEKHGRYPEILEDLVRDNIIDRIPDEPLGGHYYFDEKDHTVHSSIMKERLKVYRSGRLRKKKRQIKELRD